MQPSPSIPPSTVERYFTLHYGIGHASLASPSASAAPSTEADEGRLNEDTCVARHHNGLCVLCISPLHPLVTRKSSSIASVDYRVELRAVRGKRKRGGDFVEARTRLCTISCESGESYNIQCSVRGVLVEYNDALAKRPWLVQQKPLTEGYLAVILPRSSELKTATDELCKAESYGRDIAG